LPKIAGLDSAVGLARIGGTKSHYLELLELFYKDAQASLELLATMPDASSLPAFTTAVHALKSALANIGAENLSQSAAGLEQAGREADWPMLRASLSPFCEKLTALLERLGEVTAAARAGDGQTRDNPEIEEALTCLQTALAAQDLDAMDAALAHLQALPLPDEKRGMVSAIADAILIMDFPKAAKAVTALLRPRD
jgi:HPt (histidine-containing phosphotransfer) domain-containing protein